MNKKNIISAIAGLALAAVALYPFFLAGNLPSYALKQDEMIAKEEGSDFAKQLTNYFILRNINELKKHIDQKYTSDLSQGFEQVIKILPNAPVQKSRFISVVHNRIDNVVTSNFSIQYKIDERWFLIGITIQKKTGGNYYMTDFNVNTIVNQTTQISDSLENLTQFKFWGQSSTHYAVITAALAILSLNIYALVTCIHTPMKNKKWLWILFILIGVGHLHFNWLDGSFSFTQQTLQEGKQINRYQLIHLPAVSSYQMLYQPFFIQFSIPLGAIIFLTRRKKWLVGTSSNIDASPPARG